MHVLGPFEATKATRRRPPKQDAPAASRCRSCPLASTSRELSFVHQTQVYVHSPCTGAATVTATRILSSFPSTGALAFSILQATFARLVPFLSIRGLFFFALLHPKNAKRGLSGFFLVSDLEEELFDIEETGGKSPSCLTVRCSWKQVI